MTDPMQRAVEVAAKQFSDDVVFDGLFTDGGRGMTRCIINAALPHLEAHFRELIAGEVEARGTTVGRERALTHAAIAAFIRGGFNG